MKQSVLKIPLLLSTALILLLGMWAGLIRLGWALPAPQPGTVAGHGPLMVCGVLGTLICLERAAALSGHFKHTGWAYLAPLMTASGGILLILDSSLMLPRLLISLGSLGLVMVFTLIIRRHNATYIWVMTIAAVCWFIGNLLWLSGQPVFQIVHWWIAFLVLTVVGERLELAQLARITAQGQRSFLLAVFIYLLGVALTIANLDVGIRIAGMGEVILAVWLLRHDIARRTIRRVELPRYIAACLLIGYIWLMVGGLFGLYLGAVRAGIPYEMILHAVLLGFIFSMIFGHAPIIIPALTGRTLIYRRIFYLPLILLHVSLVLRIAGDLLINIPFRQWGGMLNVVALLLFMSVIVLTMLLASKQALTPSSQEG